MILKRLLPVLAVLLLGFAIFEALRQQRPERDVPPPIAPPNSPFGDIVAGIGVVEASTNASGTGNIAVGSQVSGVIVAVRVRVGDDVRAGDVLLELDSRQAAAELRVRNTALAVAREQVQHLKLQPRPEEVPPRVAQVAVAEADRHAAEDRLERARKLAKENALTEEELILRSRLFESTSAQVEVAKSNLALLRAGAWKAELAVAEATVEQAEALVDQARIMLDLLTVRAPVDGRILQVNVRPGEYTSTLGAQALILMGNVRPLHVRVSVDEEDIPRLQPQSTAVAHLRGSRSQVEIPLTFVRFEPYVIPKMSLTGANIERVDTRVAQLIFAVSPDEILVKENKLLIGQIVDVFIQAGRKETPAPMKTSDREGDVSLRN